jgi:hypothetical protein
MKIEIRENSFNWRRFADIPSGMLVRMKGCSDIWLRVAEGMVRLNGAVDPLFLEFLHEQGVSDNDRFEILPAGFQITLTQE